MEDNTRPYITRQDNNQARQEHDMTRQEKTGQHNIRQDKTRQDTKNTSQHKTRQSQTLEDDSKKGKTIE